MPKLRRHPLVARRRRQLSPFVLVEVLVSVVVLLVGVVIFLVPSLRSRAATVNANCTLIVPAHPLTARGLATPYQLTATDPANARCNAPPFFAACNRGGPAHRVSNPPRQTAKAGQSCATVRDFNVVDQGQSDNVQAQYLAANGQTAQFSAANQAMLQNATPIANP